MNLKHLLGLNKKVNLSDELHLTDQAVKNEPIIKETLFVDNLKPKNNMNKLEQEINPKPLSIVLGKRWTSSGYDDGYSTPNAERMDIRIKAIISEISLAISKTIESLKNEKDLISNQIVSLNSDKSMGVTSKQLQLKKERLVEEIISLDEDKEMLYEHKGTFSKPIHEYVNGFSEGVNDCVKRNLLSKTFEIY
tara:strand:- start:968 stop:1546 length:579 start_codon:yes stop_codon:yes gene_type:complete